MMAMIIYLGMMVLFSTLTSVSRLTWAFARDKGLPFSKFFAHIHPTLHIPLNSLLLDTAVTVLLMLINIGSTTAFYAIVSLSTLALYISYIIPMVFFTLAKLRGDHIPYGPFHMNKALGLATNFFGITWAVFIVIFLPFPPLLPVTASKMNYAGKQSLGRTRYCVGSYLLLAGSWKQALERCHFASRGKISNLNVFDNSLPKRPHLEEIIAEE